MAIHQQHQEHHQEQEFQENSCFLIDTLYCEEEKWDDETTIEYKNQEPMFSFFPLTNLLEQDLFWEDGELLTLFSKENEQKFVVNDCNSVARQEGVVWMLKVNGHYGFSALTAVLAVNYFDRFLSTSYFQKDKPWMIQLVAVTCLSLAAKVEETQVPLLLDLQVEDSKFVFEAKTIQRMELLVLSALKWKMHPVTPLSFLDHIIRRLGLKTNLHWEFLKRCENLLITLVSDSRSVNYVPSVLATATMMYVIDQVELFNPIDYQNQLLGVLKITKEKVKDCYELILELSSKTKANGYHNNKCYKRKFEAMPSSPSGVIDAIFSSDNSNDSWVSDSSIVSSSSSSSSPDEPLFKKSRAQDQWVFVDIVANSPH
ncbi:cyclin-D3-1 [Mercurialis annua]|uniref:cyclin-D3-1 n=1 Tax=Mercurialis annua TaxID=3986 RepID=UPI00215F4F0E|nr:cyclin-D3-1 [Mercurialis annua]